METLIRPVHLNDTAAINSLSAQLGYSASVNETEEMIREVLSANDNCAFAAVENGKIIGWIHAFKTVRMETKPFIEIGGLVVDEQYRGKGTGKKLVQHVREWCHEKNIIDLRVRCNTKRKEAHQFYLALGFTESKEQKIFQARL
jgi:GNAT superfamily N-acetyltransferase